jgi:hypothetical protein
MWTLKENIKIILRRHGLIITREALANNQSLAEIILNDPLYSARYGHNLVRTDDPKTPQAPPTIENEEVIEVNIKKKGNIMKEQGQQLDLFGDSALTFDNAGNDGMVLNVKEAAPRSKSNASKRSRPTGAKDGSQQKSSDVSAAT